MSSMRIVATSALVTAAVATACGIRSPLLDDLATADSDDAGAIDATPAAEDASDAAYDARDADEAGDDAALPAADLGNVFITAGSYGDAGASTVVSAAFYLSVTATGCTRSSVAPGCIETVCAAVDASAPTPLASAGTLSITGGAFPMRLVPASSGAYFQSATDALFRGDEVITVAASGGDAPPFIASVVAPTTIAVTSPSSLGTLVVDRTQPLAIVWGGGSEGNVEVDVDSASSYFLACTYDPASGRADVPAAALKTLPAGVATLRVSTVTAAHVDAGAWFMATFASSEAADPTGAPFVGNVTLQ